MASPGNRHCASCIGTLSFPINVYIYQHERAVQPLIGLPVVLDQLSERTQVEDPRRPDLVCLSRDSPEDGTDAVSVHGWTARELRRRLDLISVNVSVIVAINTLSRMMVEMV